jgi:hypothetical protein
MQRYRGKAGELAESQGWVKTGLVCPEESQSHCTNQCPLPRHRLKHRRRKLRGDPKQLVLSPFCLPFLSLYQVQIANLWGHRDQGGLSQPQGSPASCSSQQLSSHHFLML